MAEERCRVVRGDGGFLGRQGVQYSSSGITAESAGARHLCLHTQVIPPGGRAKAHRHDEHESAVLVVSGEGEMWWGEELEHYERLAAGDLVYIPAGVPHLPGNPSADTPALAVVARTDPNEQESVVLLPELDERATRPE